MLLISPQPYEVGKAETWLQTQGRPMSSVAQQGFKKNVLWKIYILRLSPQATQGGQQQEKKTEHTVSTAPQ